MAEKLLTMEQIKRKELMRAHDALVAIRSSAYLWNNIPPECLEHVEYACNEIAQAIENYNLVMGELL